MRTTVTWGVALVVEPTSSARPAGEDQPRGGPLVRTLEVGPVGPGDLPIATLAQP
ncbi:hypothetical protein [Nannocystis exedens]|uniref:hypothetical protein n=1 Tax=Nannocystis exedens TaxID=54 RepID=UPI0014745CDE|nr:hypothetical protein [Nannocystis exedens]